MIRVISSVLTRNMSSIIDQIDVKLSNLKNELISELKDQIFELKSFIHDQMDTIKDLTSKVIQNEATIAVLQNNMKKLKYENKELRNKILYWKVVHLPTLAFESWII